MVTIPRMVTLKLQFFLLYMNLALRNSYWAGSWLSKVLTGQEFGSQISLPDMLPKLNTFDLSLVFSNHGHTITILITQINKKQVMRL